MELPSRAGPVTERNTAFQSSWESIMVRSFVSSVLFWVLAVHRWERGCTV